MTQDLHPSGAVGDATLATAGKGDAALAHGAQAFVELLREIDRFDLARLRDGPLRDRNGLRRPSIGSSICQTAPC